MPQGKDTTQDEIWCPTPRCVEVREKYGYGNEVWQADNDVSPPDNLALCQRCGGVLDDGKWVHRCARCKKEVEPGGLCGLFVPTRCPECQHELEEADRRSGNRCLKCGTIRINCCC